MRVHIRLNTNHDVVEFINILNGTDSTAMYSLETSDGSNRVDARSFLGVLYFTVEHSDDAYLTSDSEEELPAALNKFYV